MTRGGQNQITERGLFANHPQATHKNTSPPFAPLVDSYFSFPYKPLAAGHSNQCEEL